MRIVAFFSAALFILAPAAGIGADTTGETKLNSKFLLSGSIGCEMGEIVLGRYQLATVDHAWHKNSIGTVNLKVIASERLTLRLGFLGRMWFNSFPPATVKEYNAGYDKYFSYDLQEAEGIYSLVNNTTLSAELAFGVMPFKYNPDVTDLGEYLFRSGTYPAYVINKFDCTNAILTGLRFGVNYTTDKIGIKFDQLVLSESEIRPFHDITIAAIASVKAFKVIDIGAGVSFAHGIPVDDRITTLKTLPDASFIRAPGDTGYYTFSGTKLMARATLDPLFSMREDLKDVIGNGGKI